MRLKFLLKPGWLALTLVVFTFAIACYTLLAPWQFSRHTERQVQNAALQESFVSEPRPLAEVLPAGTAPDEGAEWRRVSVTGTYLAEDEVIARLRTVLGEPAFEVLAPFRTTGGQVVLVDRGYLQPDQRSRVPSYAAPPETQVELVGRVRVDETDPHARPVFANEATDGRLHTYSVDSQLVGAATGLDIRPGYLQLDAGQPGALGTLPLPQVEAGPFLSYALQWIAFGTMTLLGWLYFTVRELKPGGVLAEQEPRPNRRKSVAQMLAEDEAAVS
ncbi:SURF1 family protein [Amycolatopsis palatopharyngis]|uniref:SURF1 family cytochrome oxidase biogenesis protein n=1 Tax=Amycolatopsis palatopharyngis TaxID=187982 RepID=UPI000E26CFCC|nr:SURF1 family cytochrome oxidase biogenesis protein [Amycolatopsis palatopharyngis]